MAGKGKTCSSGWKLDTESRYTFLSKGKKIALKQLGVWCYLTTGRAVHCSCCSVVQPYSVSRPPCALCLGGGCSLNHLSLADTRCARCKKQQLKFSGLPHRRCDRVIITTLSALEISEFLVVGYEAILA